MSVANLQTTHTSDDSAGVTQDLAFEVLSCRRRRHALHYLLQQQRTVELRELSTNLAAWENDVPVESVTYKQRMRVYTALRQSHLPKMDAKGVIAFDPNRGTATLTDEASELEVYLDVVPHNEIRWSKYYVGLGGLCAGLVLAGIAGVFPFSELPGMGLAGLVTTLFLVSAVIHSYHDMNNRLGRDGEPPT
ncbi:MAG: DUF7344 domain-containing protein [Halobacteriota archaeon]